MISVEKLMSIPKSGIQEASEALDKGDIAQLAEWLSLKDDNIRYQAFLLLQNRSAYLDDVYPYWDTFRGKLKSGNSYQRSIGLMLIAENVRWDTKNKMEDALGDYLALLNDEKPVTIRQCIQSLAKITPYKPALNEKIADCLISFDLTAVKETMRKSILLDIINVLLLIRKENKSDKIQNFIKTALSGELLDKKTKKQIELELDQ